MSRIELRIPGESAEVPLAAACVAALAGQVLPPAASHEIELAACEALNNVVKHAYGRLGHGEIVVLWEACEHALRLTIRDWGRGLPTPLPAAALPAVDPEDIDGLPEGGYGLGLVHTLMDRVDYESADGCNTLTLVRTREAPYPVSAGGPRGRNAG